MFQYSLNESQLQLQKEKYARHNAVESINCSTSISGLSFAHLNVRSLFSKMDEITYILSNTNIHVLSLNETRLNDTFSDSDVYIEGFSLFRNDRDGAVGGIAF